MRVEYYSDDLIEVTYTNFNDDQQWTWVHEYDDTDNIIKCEVIPYESAIQEGMEKYTEEYIETGHVKSTADLYDLEHHIILHI